ncbi:MAG TPA: cytochrome c biogenesis protein CcdA [Candidatus Thermoplasmatota archaeon]|nr:cytochrome c biogenesis protein CcdA [Candidatus Thermoplasmatota archaeon]
MRLAPQAVAFLVFLFVGAVGGLYVAVTSVEAAPPDFQVPTTTNETFRLSDHRGQIVVLEFFGTTCAPCKIIEADLKRLVPTWNESEVEIVSIAVWEESLDELRSYQTEHEIPWTVAQNADQANLKYNVYDIPHIVILDRAGQLAYQQKGFSIDAQTIDAKVTAALANQLEGQGLVQYGLLGLAVVAGAAAFFSPCAVGMLPAYVAHAVRTPDGRGAKTSGLGVGVWAALGVLLVFFGVGGLALAAGPIVTRYVPFLQPLVGFLLVVFGILLLARPYSIVLQRVTAPLSQWAADRQSNERTPGSFFAYGVGYGAAAAGCTTPVLLSVFVTAAAYGPLLGTGIVLGYSITGAFFMILITLAATTFREQLASRLVRYSRIVETFSALVFVGAGLFLIWYAARAGTFAA